MTSNRVRWPGRDSPSCLRATALNYNLGMREHNTHLILLTYQVNGTVIASDLGCILMMMLACALEM